MAAVILKCCPIIKNFYSLRWTWMSWRWGLAAPQVFSGFQEPSLTRVRFMHSRGNSENSPWSLCNLLYILGCAVLGAGCYSVHVTLRGGKNILQPNDRVLEITLTPYWRRVSGAGHFFLISQWNNVGFFSGALLVKQHKLVQCAGIFYYRRIPKIYLWTLLRLLYLQQLSNKWENS